MNQNQRILSRLLTRFRHARLRRINQKLTLWKFFKSNQRKHDPSIPSQNFIFLRIQESQAKKTHSRHSKLSSMNPKDLGMPSKGNTLQGFPATQKRVQLSKAENPRSRHSKLPRTNQKPPLGRIWRSLAKKNALQVFPATQSEPIAPPLADLRVSSTRFRNAVLWRAVGRVTPASANYPNKLLEFHQLSPWTSASLVHGPYLLFIFFLLCFVFFILF